MDDQRLAAGLIASGILIAVVAGIATPREIRVAMLAPRLRRNGVLVLMFVLLRQRARHEQQRTEPRSEHAAHERCPACASPCPTTTSRNMPASMW